MEFKEIELLVKLMVDNKLDRLLLPGTLELQRSKHDVPKQSSADKLTNNNQALLDEDELLFYSTSSPSLTQKEIEELASNPPPRKQRIRKSKES